MDFNTFICCGDFNTSFERSNGQTECLNSFITRNNLCISWNHPVSKKRFYIHKFIVKSIFGTFILEHVGEIMVDIY